MLIFILTYVTQKSHTNNQCNNLPLFLAILPNSRLVYFTSYHKSVIQFIMQLYIPIMTVQQHFTWKLFYLTIQFCHRSARLERHCGNWSSQTGHSACSTYGTRPQNCGWQKCSLCRSTTPAAASPTAATAESSVRCSYTKDSDTQVRTDGYIIQERIFKTKIDKI